MKSNAFDGNYGDYNITYTFSKADYCKDFTEAQIKEFYEENYIAKNWTKMNNLYNGNLWDIYHLRIGTWLDSNLGIFIVLAIIIIFTWCDIGYSLEIEIPLTYNHSVCMVRHRIFIGNLSFAPL